MSRFVLTAQLQLQAPTNVAQIARQIQSQLNNVSVNVQVQNVGQAQRQLNNVTTSINNATTAADRMGRAFGTSIRRFAAFGIATRAVSLFTSTLSSAIKDAIEFERELVKVIQVSGATRKELSALVNTVNRLSSSLGVSSRDVLQAGKVLVQAGVSFDDARIALDALAKSALAPNFDSLAETTEGAVAILAQFKQGVGALEGQLSSVNAVAGAFAVEASDLIDVVRRAGGVFKSSGGNLNELLALFTSVRATTRESAESIGTGLRTIFTRIQRPKTIEFLKQFGIQLTDLNGRFVGPFEAVKRLSDALAGLGEGDISFIRIAEELGGFRQIGKVLPLLQQFQISQEALNVAQNAGTGLTKDALTAQQALAVRITKVKEEFLALARSITETASFQVFANTALNLASALIKLADALQPIIPLLTAVAGIRLARGFGNFAGGILGGLGSARTFNKGGKVHHFARGGMVPGSGNRDTVPAMLTPGEFVIRKSSVGKLGAGNLAAMNENRYNRGTGPRGVLPLSSDASNRLNFLQGRPRLTKSEQVELQNLQNRQQGSDPRSVISGGTFSGKFGISFLKGLTQTPIQATISQILKTSNRTGANRLKAAILKKTGANNLNQIQYQNAVLKAPNATPTYLQPRGAQIFEDEIIQGVPKLFDKATQQFSGTELDPKNVSINQLLSKSAIGSIEGQFFEAFVRRITNNVIQDSKNDAIFDFQNLAASKKDINLLFGDQPFVLPNEFKNDASSTSNIASAIGKGLSLPSSRLQFFNLGGMIKKFATGGNVGTDTVPALLTPGEFVVNRKSAQNIGYGNLNRMNKVGKYAKGGIVQHFANGTGPTGVQRRSSSQIPNVRFPPGFQQLGQAAATTATNVTQLGQSANNASQANNNTRQATSNAGLALSLIPATIQSFLPPIDESSGALAKLTSSALNMVTMLGSVVFALQSFGVSLNKSSILQFLSGKGLNPGALQGVFNTLANLGGPNLARGVTSLIGGLSKLAGPLSLATAGFFVLKEGLKSVGEALYNFEARLNNTISSGDVNQAGQIAAEQIEFDNLSARIIGKSIGTAVGAVGLGTLFSGAGPAGTVTGATLGGVIGGEIGEDIAERFFLIGQEVITAARAAAQLTKTQNSLQQASEKTTEAMDDFQRGAITATQALQATTFASQEVINLRKENEAANTAAENSRDSATSAGFRDFFTVGGLLGESSRTRNTRIDKEIEDRNKATQNTEKERIKQAQPQLQAIARQIAGRDGAAGDFNAYLQQIKFADPALYEILIRQGTEQLEKQFNNIATEVKRAQDAFKAMNLELQGVAAAANAGVVGLNNYLSAQEFGNNALNQTISILEASVTSAAQGISDADFGQALSDASESLLELGATPEQVAKVQNNIRAVNTAQKQFPSALESLRKTFEEDVKAGRGVNASPERQKVLIGDILNQQLKDAGISEEARAAFKAQFDNLDLDPNAINKLLAGDLSVLEGPLKEIGEAALQQLIPVLKAQAEAQDVLNKVLRSKIELENQLVSAQRQRLDIELEAAEIAAKYGGPAVTPEIRRQNVIAQANVQAGRTGAPALTQGTAAEFNARSAATRNRLNEITNTRLQAAGEGPAAQAARQELRNGSGVQLEAEQRRLQELAKSDFETTKQLIKLKEDELQLIKEKNKLEQDSIQSLISGDIEKFFEQQAAVGATAAIATGNQSLMNAFGASALGAAAQDIQRQQQAGQQTLFGQQLGGANGLTERAFGAALGARGVQDPRLAAIAAGTTAEEVSLQKDIVDLAGTLNNYGDFLIENANNELLAADKQLQAAQQQLDAATQRVQQKQQEGQTAKPLPPEVAAGKRFGGLIYASTGKFIDFKPRGTDTVPAMLTPGEFVVRREAVQRGNNLSILKSMNRGQSAPSSDGVAAMARGGVVRYREDGSTNAEAGGGFGSFIQSLSNFGNALINFNQKFEDNINKLNNTTFNVKLDSNNINVNLTGSSFLQSLSDDIYNKLLSTIADKLNNGQVSNDGNLRFPNNKPITSS